MSRTCWIWPDSSPLCHSLLRDLDLYAAWFLATVRALDSRFIQATIRMRPVVASWALAGTRPSLFQARVSRKSEVMESLCQGQWSSNSNTPPAVSARDRVGRLAATAPHWAVARPAPAPTRAAPSQRWRRG